MNWPGDSLKILGESFILVGAAIMLFTILYVRNIISHKRVIKYGKRLRVLLAFMLIFLIGYTAVFFTAHQNNIGIFFVLTGLIVFIGSIFVYLAMRTSVLAINDLGHYTNELETSAATQRNLENVLDSNRNKLLKQNKALFFLTKDMMKKQNEEQSLQLLTEKAAEILNVNRVSIWLFDDQMTHISCVDLYTTQPAEHSHGQKIYKKDHPVYFNALETQGLLVADDALTDPRLIEFSKDYLIPLGIASMMDMPILLDGKLKGVLCSEVTGQPRKWAVEEQSFAAALADTVAITMETYKRREITEQLALSESTFRNAFEFSGIGMALASPDGKWMKVNKELCRIVGYSEQELLTRTFQDITHPDDVHADFNILKELLSGKRDTRTIEKRYFHKDGSVIWVNLTVSLVRKNQEPLFFISQIEDITERKKTRKDLELSLALTKATIEATADGILVVNNEGKVTDFNEKFMELWQIPENIMETHDTKVLLEYILPQLKDPEAFMSRIDEIRATLGEVSMDVIYFKDGRVYERYSKLQLAEKEVVGRVWSFRDVTLQKQAENEIKKLNVDLEDRVRQRTQEVNALNEELKANIQSLELANKDLESFTSSVSHDLRAPLRGINGFISLLEKKSTTLDPDSQKFLGIISDNAKKMDQLIEDLLAFSRLGKKELEKTHLDMNELLKEVVAGINIHEWNANTKLTIKDMLPAYGDPNLLKQVFFNLIANSVKYSRRKEDPEIEIGSYGNETENTYFVKDNGVGFNMQYYDKLFKVFQRLHSAADFEGVGVGLAIVQRIVMKHGGKAWAEAEEDKGATFSFTLPVDTPQLR